MNIFDVIGPVMVGPSSSHTAGAVKIGRTALRLLKEPVQHADIYLYGSFALTGKGHGTDKALVAGLLGLAVDDSRIPDSFQLAHERGLSFQFHANTDEYHVHPNSARLSLTGVDGKKLTMLASSPGASRILVNEINGVQTSFSGESPTIIVRNEDHPGCIAKVTGILRDHSVNIARMSLTRENRGGYAAMILETDQEVSEDLINEIRHTEGVQNAVYLGKDKGDTIDVSIH